VSAQVASAETLQGGIGTRKPRSGFVERRNDILANYVSNSAHNNWTIGRRSGIPQSRFSDND
jgi:hypothetical protein